MDYGGSQKREVERIVPFNDRATKCITELKAYREALMLFIGHDGKPMLQTMARAELLLLEAKTRGVKGKEVR